METGEEFEKGGDGEWKGDGEGKGDDEESDKGVCKEKDDDEEFLTHVRTKFSASRPRVTSKISLPRRVPGMAKALLRQSIRP